MELIVGVDEELIQKIISEHSGKNHYGMVAATIVIDEGNFTDNNQY